MTPIEKMPWSKVLNVLIAAATLLSAILLSKWMLVMMGSMLATVVVLTVTVVMLTKWRGLDKRQIGQVNSILWSGSALYMIIPEFRPDVGIVALAVSLGLIMLAIFSLQVVLGEVLKLQYLYWTLSLMSFLVLVDLLSAEFLAFGTVWLVRIFVILNLAIAVRSSWRTENHT